MQLFEKFKIVGVFPALYWPEQEMVVISDLHLGLEGLLAQSGIMMPHFQLDALKEELQAIFEETAASTLLINGDVKHEFSRTSFSERNEILELLQCVLQYVDEVYIVKGNHDNYIYYAVQEYPEVLLEDYFLIDDVLFMHGHLELDLTLENVDFRYIIIGNEHPAISLQDEVGVKAKVPCFLYGPLDIESGRRIIVLPSISKLSSGADMNDVFEGDFLSPILQRIDVGKLQAIGLADELLEFPAIERLRG